MSPCHPLVQGKSKKVVGFLCRGANLQPATRWYDPNIGWKYVRGKGLVAPRRRFWVRWSPHKILRAQCCGRYRRARNLVVKPDYDHLGVFCKQGTGCPKEKK